MSLNLASPVSLRIPSTNLKPHFLDPEKGLEDQESLNLELQESLPLSEESAYLKEFKGYRYHSLSPKGPVTEEEYQIFVEIFQMLSSLGYFGLFKKKGKIEELKGRVFHIHPFNFLETLVLNDELKKLFIKVKKSGSFIWSKCRNNFKDELKLQNEMGNIQPHLSNFSTIMQVSDLELIKHVSESKIDDMINTLLNQHSI